MNELQQLWARTKAISSALERLHRPERGRTLYKVGHEALAVRYTVTPGSVPYIYTYWTVSGIVVPAGAVLELTATLDIMASASAYTYLLMINGNPPTGVVNPWDRDGKYPHTPHNMRLPVTLELRHDYEAETSPTTCSISFSHQANTASVTYNVYETWSRLRWAIWL